MRILVIGGTGFIGRFLVPHLVEHGHAVTVYHRGHAEPALAASVDHILGTETIWEATCPSSNACHRTW